MSLTILRRTSTQSITASTWTAASWSSAITDPVAAWVAGSPTIVTTPSGAAFMDMVFHPAWADGGLSNNRGSRLLINGTVQEYHYYKSFDRSPQHHPTRRYAVSAGDTVGVEIWHDSSTNPLNFYDSADASTTPTVQFRWWTS